MDDVSGVADERDAVGDERARDGKAERMDPPRADGRDLAEMQLEAALELGTKAGIGQRHDALGLARRFGPHDRRAPSLERQDRERPGRQEMLLGASAMVAFMPDSGDDRRLAVAPAVRGDAGAFADRRTRAVGGDQKPRRDRVAVRKLDIDVLRRAMRRLARPLEKRVRLPSGARASPRGQDRKNARRRSAAFDADLLRLRFERAR